MRGAPVKAGNVEWKVFAMTRKPKRLEGELRGKLIGIIAALGQGDHTLARYRWVRLGTTRRGLVAEHLDAEQLAVVEAPETSGTADTPTRR